MTKPIYALSGPNLNLLGKREPEIYGTDTLDDIHARMQTRAGTIDVVARQSNHEGELVDWIQEAKDTACAIILNAGAYTHTSLAIHDALRAVSIPVIEIHVSNPAAREAFRHVNHISSVATATIAGAGAYGYELAVDAALHMLSGKT
ncbi:MAG: type II 3-dehydroquinate dehydratase [Pseudomonadota bacterium]